MSVLRDLDEHSEDLQLVPTPSGLSDGSHAVFEAWVDGIETPVKIKLSSSGTWIATTHIAVGEKPQA
jgi:hypothetical protein